MPMDGYSTGETSGGGAMTRRTFATVCASLGLSTAGFAEALADEAGDAAVVTPGMIEAAGTAAGLELNPDELERLAKGVNGLIEAYRALRTVPIGNDIQPALAFNPLLPGTMTPVERKPLRFEPQGDAMPADDRELAYCTVTRLARLIETRRITSTRLTKRYLERLKRYDPILKCVVALTESRALAQAERADREIAAGNYRGILHGIPWGVKDLFAVSDYPTAWGAGCYRDRIIDTDSTVVERLDAAGAVLIAKLSTGRFASGPRWFGGETKNPWNTDMDSSGSSAGPGAATAAGLVGFAVGTETRGSIAGPSERCGVTGLRPTFGRVSRHGAMALCWSMDKPGPLCRSAEDCAAVLNAIHGTDGRDISAVDMPFNYDYSMDVRKLRVGYVEGEFSGAEGSPGERAAKNQALYAAVLDTLRNMGVRLVPIEIPDFAQNLAYIVLCTEAATALDYMNTAMDDLVEDDGSPVKRYPEYRFVPAVEYLQVNRYRTLVMREMARVMESVDAYVTPTFVGPTNYLTNMTGHPEVILPCGFREGMPVAISFVGGLWREGELLALARAYQMATGFHERHPSL